jgi:hypothetical protein
MLAALFNLPINISLIKYSCWIYWIFGEIKLSSSLLHIFYSDLL